jgi:hypothetical protein
MHHERPAFCPKCGQNCVMEEDISQQRKNTCTSCGISFYDGSEQFKSNYFAVYTESMEPNDPPLALFLDKEMFEEWKSKLDGTGFNEYRDHHVGAERASVYGVSWLTSDDDPWADTFQEFFPDDLERLSAPRVSIRNVSQPSLAQFEVHLDPIFVLGEDVPVYEAIPGGRYYLFYRSGEEQPPDYASIAVPPKGKTFAKIYLHGIYAALRTNEKNVFLSFNEFTLAGGQVTHEQGGWNVKPPAGGERSVGCGDEDSGG